MSRILFLYDCPRHHSGIPALLQRLVGALVAQGTQLILALPKRPCGIPLYTAAEESYPAGDGQLDILWWPDEFFDVRYREQFVFEIERLHAERPLQRIMALDARTGFAAVVAGRLASIPVSVFVTYRDAFSTHYTYPQELDVVTQHADHLVSANPEVPHHLSMFYDVAPKWTLVDTRPTAIELATSSEPCEPVHPDRPYLVTTGMLSELIGLGDLLQRVEQFLSDGADEWIHAGTCDASTLLKIGAQLTARGLADRFQILESLHRDQYVALLRAAMVHLVPLGERDTNLAVYESQSWGVRLDLPQRFPFPALSSPEESDSSSQSDALTPVQFAGRLLA